MKNEICHNTLIVNSQLLDKEDVNFSDYEQGTIIYEVIRLIDGISLFFNDHLMRLHYSANLAGLNLTINDDEIINSIKILTIENQIFNGNVKLMFHFIERRQVFFYCYFVNHSYPVQTQYEDGVDVDFFQTERKSPNIKSLNIDYKSKTIEFIKENSIYEALLVDRNGWITEGSKSNVFFIKDNRLFTAPKTMILPGVTRNYILKLANLSHMDVIEECVHINDISNFDSAFITGTSPKVLPIRKINNICFDVGNKILRKLMNDYNKEILDYTNHFYYM